MTMRRAALWTLVAAKIVGGFGLTWDIQWHVTIGRDSFWIAPHVMMYASVALAVVVGFAVLARDTLWSPGTSSEHRPLLRVLGLRGTRGFHLATWGVAVVVLAAPVDDLWHRMFGLDVTLWSPPHLLGLFGSALNSLGCVVIANEVYGARRAAGLAGILISGALFFGGIRVVLDPAYLVAYHRGGVLFHAYSIMAALVLPLALVPVARLANLRWAPVAVIAIAIALVIAGEAVAQIGFAILRPVSVIGEEIRKDPGSAIATANAIAAKNGPRPAWVRVVPLVAAMVMSLVDPRTRLVGATVAYALATFATSAWYLAGRAAYRPLVPGVGEATVALALTLVSALLGAIAARWLARAIVHDRDASPTPVDRVGIAAREATSPGR